MELEKYLFKTILKVVIIGFLFVLPSIVGKGISIAMSLDYENAICIMILAYFFEFVLVLFIAHYINAKKYMKENNVSPKTAWERTGYSDGNEY